LGGGNRYNTVEWKAQKSAKIDKITEKRQFPMNFYHKTFNLSISPIYEQIAIINNGIY
jgi:hypothetical protein